MGYGYGHYLLTSSIHVSLRCMFKYYGVWPKILTHLLVWLLCTNDGFARSIDRSGRSMDLSFVQASVDRATIDRLHSAIYGSVDITVEPSSEYRSMKCNMNNIILVLTLTLTDPVTPYFMWPLVNNLAKGGRSGGGFVGVTVPDLQLFLRQFLRMSVIWQAKYQDPGRKVWFGCVRIVSKDNT